MTVRILHGDCRAVLDTLPDNSVHCCVTSPPYWGLRSYLPDDHPSKHLEIGSEPTVDMWVATMVDVFRKVRRVLRDDGVLLLNLGDSYAGSRSGPDEGSTLQGSRRNQNEAKRAKQAMTASRRRDDHEIPRSDVRMPGYKNKDLIGQPWMVAFALRADGWWLRQEIIWSKPNPMPESVRDRCTKAHEHIFLLSKSERYFWNFDAIQEPVNGGAKPRRAAGTGVGFGHGFDEKKKPRARRADDDRRPKAWDVDMGSMRTLVDGHARKLTRTDGKYGPLSGHATDGAHRTKAGLNRKLAEHGSGIKSNESYDAAIGSAGLVETRNPRSVWTIPTHPFKGAHFATFPPELARRCIAAGCPPGGTVLDPFGGSGTVGLEADRAHCNAILIDLDERNLPMAEQRITADAPLFAEVAG